VSVGMALGGKKGARREMKFQDQKMRDQLLGGGTYNFRGGGRRRGIAAGRATERRRFALGDWKGGWVEMFQNARTERDVSGAVAENLATREQNKKLPDEGVRGG